MRNKIFLWRLAACLAAGLIPSLQASPGTSETTGHKVRVHDDAGARAIAAQGGRLVEDYGGFKIYNLPQITANLPRSAELMEDYNSILLNSIPLNTARGEMQAARRSVGTFSGKRMHLVHFAGPILPAWRQALLDAGVEIVTYIPQNAYLVYGDAGSIARVQAMAGQAPQVQWDGEYLADYKIHPAARMLDAKGQPIAHATNRFTIQLMADNAANQATLKLIDQLKLGPVLRQSKVLHYVNVVVPLAAADLSKIAARPDVVSIHAFSLPKKVCERQDQIVAGNLSGNQPGGPGYLNWLAGRGFTQQQFDASGFIIDVSDSGIDNGTIAPNHFGLYETGNVSGSSRVMYNILQGTPNQGSTLAGCDGHGNLNAHIVMGYDDSSGFPFADSDGYHYGLGVCPFVKVGSSVIFDPINSTNPDDNTVVSTAYSQGARICNNSWGDSDASGDGSYNADCQAYDALVRDAEPSDAPYSAPGNQEMVIVFAAGNDGENGKGQIVSKSVSPPGTAKNVITVGAADNVQPFSGCDSSGVCDVDADDANAVVDFSSRGPTDDGRRKPDLVAPGTHVSGGAPQANRTGPSGDGDALSCFTELAADDPNDFGVSGGVGTNGNTNPFFPDNQQFYTASSGTSHSTPCVTGGCALVRQYFINNFSPPPSPAMTKAFLMNSARYMTGSGADDTLWSESQGMGEMDLGMAFDGAPRLLSDEDPTNIFTASGQTRVFTGSVDDPAKPFRVTLAWTDAPGNTSGAAYNNDLDLTVSIGGNTYLGNVFSGATSVTGGSADTKDNVESVFLPAGVTGTFTITVTAASINSVGVPNNSNALTQDFALVAYNATPGSKVVAAGYSLTTNEPCPGTAINPGETVTVNFVLQNLGNAATSNLVATLLMTNGILFPGGPQSYGALTPGASGTNAFTFTADGSCGETNAAVLQLQDGSSNLGTVSYSFALGTPFYTTNYVENFDTDATPPALPPGWSTTVSASDLTQWTTESTNSGTAPNAVYCPDSANAGGVTLISPGITLAPGTNQLIFRNQYNLEPGYDGGVLQISIAGGAFTDIVAAGGSFVSNGYNGLITDAGDTGGKNAPSPLINRNAWTGNSGGFITTIVNLPASASGTNVQFEWICGTDDGNYNLTGTGGWWIDSLAIAQPAFDCCAPPTVANPTINFPTNGYPLSAFAPELEVAGFAPAGAQVVISNNGGSNGAVLAGEDAIYSIVTTLAFGTNTLTATVNGTNSSTNIIVYVALAPPTLTVPNLTTTNVAVSGSGAAGATVDLFQGTNATGSPLASFVVNASGNYSGTVSLPAGAYTLTATEAISNQVSSNAPPVPVTVVSEPAPAILSPASGTIFTRQAVVITGKAQPGARLTLYDISSGVTNSLTNITMPASGKFSATVKLAQGTNDVFASQTINGAAGPPGAVAVYYVYLAPIILVQPVNQTNFLKGTVTFSAIVAGAPPLKLYWTTNYTTNKVKLPGADTAKLTLSNLRESDTLPTYRLVVTNKNGVAYSTAVTVTLVTNPFTNLAGAYDGLFMQSPPQFQSSGLLSLTLTTQGKFTAKILCAGGTYSFADALSGVGWDQVSVSRGPALSPLTVVLNLNVTNGQDQIQGTVSAGTDWVSDLTANLTPFAATKSYPNAGKYTAILATPANGDGFGTVTVTSSGLASLNGVLPDNTSVVSAPAGISRSNLWPLYIPLYGKYGSLVGWIDFTNAADSSLTGANAAWFRINSDGKLYPGGFTNDLDVSGSAYSAAGNATLLNETNLEVFLSGGSLADVLSNSVTPSASGKFTVGSGGISGLTLSLSPATGAVKGSFTDPATGTTAPIKGMIFQQQTNAAGFFLGPTNGGFFYLAPP